MEFITQQISNFRHWLAARLRPQADVESMRELGGWSQTALGCALLSDQQEKMDEVVDCMFGYHLMTMGVFDTPNLCRKSKINHKFVLAPNDCGSNGLTLQDGTANGVVQAAFEQLPLAPESIDVAVLHHALDYAENPHQALREVVKSVIPRGYVVILGFNPWGAQGLWRLVLQWRGKGVWRRHSLRASRLEDWLRLLDCEPLRLERGFYRLPIDNPWLLEKFRFLEAPCRALRLPWGSYYLLVARKDVVGMTPIKTRWGSYRPAMGLVVGKPSVPQSSHKRPRAG
jgi:SAM-dependent methyltransferase